MKKNLAILAILLASAAAYTLYEDLGTAPKVVTASEKTTKSASVPAPDFSFTDLAGKEYTLENFRDKAVILNFWASWCAPCIIEFPQMLELAKATKDHSIFLFVSQDEERAAIDRFLKKYGAGLPQDNVIIAHDRNKAIATSYQTFKLPETYLIDAKGMIREKIIGADAPWTSSEMQEKIKVFGQR